MPSPSRLEKRTDMLVVPLSREERRRLDAWAHQQEREASQAIRFLLREVLTEEATARANGSGPSAA